MVSHTIADCIAPEMTKRGGWYVAWYAAARLERLDLEPFHKGERFLYLITAMKFTSREVALKGSSHLRGYSNSSAVVLLHGRTPKRIVQYQLSEE